MEDISKLRLRGILRSLKDATARLYIENLDKKVDSMNTNLSGQIEQLDTNIQDIDNKILRKIDVINSDTKALSESLAKANNEIVTIKCRDEIWSGDSDICQDIGLGFVANLSNYAYVEIHYYVLHNSENIEGIVKAEVNDGSVKASIKDIYMNVLTNCVTGNIADVLISDRNVSFINCAIFSLSTGGSITISKSNTNMHITKIIGYKI